MLEQRNIFQLENTLKKYIWTILTLLWIGVIFSFSLQPAAVSEGVSVGFGRWLLETVAGKLWKGAESLSAERLDCLHHLLRKAAHFSEYFLLGILMGHTLWQYGGVLGTLFGQELAGENCRRWDLRPGNQSCVGSGKRGVSYRGLGTLLLCAAVAAVDETIQLFVSGRSGQLSDVLLDSCGALTGILLYMAGRRMLRKWRRF